MNTITEQIKKAHEYNNEFGEIWHVLNNKSLDVVKYTYVYNDDGSKKDKPFKSIYNTESKKYGRNKVKYFNKEVFYFDYNKKLSSEESIKLESLKEFKNIFKKYIVKFKEVESDIDCLNEIMFVSFFTDIIDIVFLREIMYKLKDIVTIQVKGILGNINEISIIANLNEFNYSKEEVINMIESFNTIDKYNL